MGIERLIPAAVAIAILAVSKAFAADNSRRTVAEIQLVQDSQASQWGRAMLPFPSGK